MTEESKTKKLVNSVPRQAILKWIPQTPTTRDEREHLANILFGEIKLPGAAFVDPKLMEIISSTESTIDQLQEHIKTAPELSISIVRMAQSAYYSRGGEINNFEDACNRIGMRVIRNLIYSHQVASAFTRFESDIDWESFWMRSILSARLTELLMNSYVGPKNFGYLSGLLQNLGSIIIQEFFPYHYPLIQEKISLGVEAHAAESEFLGFTHAHVGGVLCMKWNFPLTASLGVYFHHDDPGVIEAKEGTTVALLAMCCLAADRLASIILASDVTQPLDSSHLASALEWTYLSRHRVLRAIDIVPETEYNATVGVVSPILAQFR